MKRLSPISIILALLVLLYTLVAVLFFIKTADANDYPTLEVVSFVGYSVESRIDLINELMWTAFQYPPVEALTIKMVDCLGNEFTSIWNTLEDLPMHSVPCQAGLMWCEYPRPTGEIVIHEIEDCWILKYEKE